MSINLLVTCYFYITLHTYTIGQFPVQRSGMRVKRLLATLLSFRLLHRGTCDAIALLPSCGVRHISSILQSETNEMVVNVHYERSSAFSMSNPDKHYVPL